MKPEELKSLLKANGMNQTTGAEKIGVSRHTVFRWVNGSVPISAGQALLIRSKLAPAKK